MAAFRLLRRGTGGGGGLSPKRAGLDFLVGNAHSHGHGAEHEALRDGLRERWKWKVNTCGNKAAALAL